MSRRRAATALVALLVVSILAAVVPRGPLERAAHAAGTTGAFVPIGPLRLADSRTGVGLADLGDGRYRIVVTNRPGVPANAIAAALTVTAVDSITPAVLTVWPSGGARPATSNVNAPGSGRTVANAVLTGLGTGGAIDIGVQGWTHVVVDLTGVFVPATSATAGRFVPVTPTRITDTRSSGGPLPAGGQLTLPLPFGVPADATAVAVNITTTLPNRPGYFTAHPTGSTRPWTSVLNTDGPDQSRAATAIVPVSPAGLTVYSSSGGNVIVDITGWFTGASAPASGDGLFAPAGPTRLLDTRTSGPPLHPNGALEVALPAAAAAAVNVTVVEARDPGYLTAGPAGNPVPGVSTVNADARWQTQANLSIVQQSTRGITVSSPSGGHVIVDLVGSFTGSPIAAPLPVPANPPPPAGRVLLVGDSTMAAIRWYGNSKVALQGFPFTLDAESCRRLIGLSCVGREGRRPSNTVEAILSKAGTYDTVVVMGGYDDWGSYFGEAFRQVVLAARAKGARQIIWLTYRVDVSYVAPSNAASDGTYRSNNRILRDQLASGAFPDVVLADWDVYSRSATSWFGRDGIHLTVAGAYGAADYISRTIAWAGWRACPQPWAIGEAVPNPCPDPDTANRRPDPLVLYQGSPYDLICYEVGVDRHVECRRS